MLTKERCEQIHWFAKSLYEDDAKNAAVLMHIYFICGADLRPTLFAKEIANCISAYNQRKQFVFEGIIYDFSKSKGLVRFILSGHVHLDVIEYLDGEIPVVAVMNAFENEKLTFDIFEIDYDKGKITINRTGNGKNREVLL